MVVELADERRAGDRDERAGGVFAVAMPMHWARWENPVSSGRSTWTCSAQASKYMTYRPSMKRTSGAQVKPVSAQDGTFARAVPVLFQRKSVVPLLIVSEAGGVSKPVWLEYR